MQANAQFPVCVSAKLPQRPAKYDETRHTGVLLQREFDGMHCFVRLRLGDVSLSVFARPPCSLFFCFNSDQQITLTSSNNGQGCDKTSDHLCVICPPTNIFSFRAGNVKMAYETVKCETEDLFFGCDLGILERSSGRWQMADDRCLVAVISRLPRTLVPSYLGKKSPSYLVPTNLPALLAASILSLVSTPKISGLSRLDANAPVGYSYVMSADDI